MLVSREANAIFKSVGLLIRREIKRATPPTYSCFEKELDSFLRLESEVGLTRRKLNFLSNNTRGSGLQPVRTRII